MKDSDECDCPCHTLGGKHIMACCRECPECKKNIKFFYFDDHLKRHRDDQEKEGGARKT